MKQFFFFLSLFLFFIPRAYAADEFSNAYDVNYEVQISGITKVSQNIRLTNKTTNFYPSEYTVVYGTEQIENITARDTQGPLKTEIKKSNHQTSIHVIFNEKIIGLGKTLSWILQFESPQIGKKNGRIWEINIPKVSPDEKIDSYNVSLIVPAELGSPIYISPPSQPPYLWTLPQSRQGISLAFGDWQGFKFNLSYHLENLNFLPGKTEIALPADTAYQKVYLQSINPKPSSIAVDEDGNWLATFLLLPKQRIDVSVSGLAQIFLEPQKNSSETNSTEFYQKYLQPQKYWEQNEPIKKLAQELKTPEEIYNFVVKTLNYDYQRATTETSRLGAAKILDYPNNAICMEFTDLFIALSRSAEIPAREVDGFAYTSNSLLKPLSLITDVLHSWPEYWDKDKNVWVQVDPTWGKTSDSDYFHHFDFNHLAFVARGLSSVYPYPAGSYKTQNNGKDVLVDYADFSLPVKNQININDKTTPTTFQAITLALLLLSLLIIFLTFLLFKKLWKTFHQKP